MSQMCRSGIVGRLAECHLPCMQDIGRRKGRAYTSAAALVAGLLGGACASSQGAPAGNGETSGPLCTGCAELPIAGGQTSDFGSGGGCQNGSVTPLDVDTARAKGFTEVDLMNQVFDAPLVWTPTETAGEPATGYDPHTSVHVELTLLGVDEVTPLVASNCPEYFRANVGFTLSTADQAISIGGVMHSYLGALVPTLEGTVDLREGFGSLMLHPDPWPAPLAGEFGVSMVLWPQGVRGSFDVRLIDASYEPSDSDVASGPRYVYAPLVAKFPDDACEPYTRPLAPDERDAALNGASPNEVVTSMAALLGPDPLPGAWSDTGDVTVTTSVGAPTSACLGSGGVGMRVPLRITSSDGRVHIDELANAAATYDADGALTNAWVEAVHDDPLGRDAFAAASGIDGVDFGDVPQASWHTELYLVSPDRPQTGPYGEIIVQGVDPNASPTAMPHELATLHWWK